MRGLGRLRHNTIPAYYFNLVSFPFMLVSPDPNLKRILDQIRQHPLSRHHQLELSAYALVIAVSLGLMLLEIGAAKSTWWYATIFMLALLIALLRIASIFNPEQHRSRD